MSPELLLRLAEAHCKTAEDARYQLTQRIQALMIRMARAEKRGDTEAFGAIGLEFLDVQQALKLVEGQVAQWDFWVRLLKLEKARQ